VKRYGLCCGLGKLRRSALSLSPTNGKCHTDERKLTVWESVGIACKKATSIHAKCLCSLINLNLCWLLICWNLLPSEHLDLLLTAVLKTEFRFVGRDLQRSGKAHGPYHSRTRSTWDLIYCQIASWKSIAVSQKGVYEKAIKRVRRPGLTPADMLSEGQYCKGEGSWSHQDMPGDDVS